MWNSHSLPSKQCCLWDKLSCKQCLVKVRIWKELQVNHTHAPCSLGKLPQGIIGKQLQLCWGEASAKNPEVHFFTETCKHVSENWFHSIVLRDPMGCVTATAGQSCGAWQDRSRNALPVTLSGQHCWQWGGAGAMSRRRLPLPPSARNATLLHLNHCQRERGHPVLRLG